VRISRQFKSFSLIAALGLVVVGLSLPSASQPDASASQIKSLSRPLSDDLPGAITAGGSRIVTTKVKGPKSHLTDTVITVLPLEYDLPQNADRSFPYLVMYSGMPGSAGSWVNYLDIATHLEDVEGDILTPVIAVLVPIYFNYDTECIDFKGYPQTGTWIGTDIPNWIKTHWRVSNARNDHVLAGFSAGGWCAAMQATMNPSAYRAVMTFAGYFAPTFDQAQLLNKDSRASKYILANTIAKSTQPISFFIGAAKDDPISYPSGKNFASTVTKKRTMAAKSSKSVNLVVKSPIQVKYEEISSGGHSFSVWERELVDALDWLPNADPALAYHGPSASPTPTSGSSAAAAPSPK
jgi:S-formylglutathione hydrolase FrmB